MMKVGLSLPQLGDHVTRRTLRDFCESAEGLDTPGPQGVKRLADFL